MTSYRRSSAEQAQSETYPIIEECTKDQGVVRRYTKGRFLGKGGFAKCYEFTNLESKKVGAAKVIPKISLTKSRAKQKLMSEIKIHRSLRHQNVVGFEHFFEDQENVYILLEMCTNQTMNELIKRRKRLTEIEVQCYLIQILNAVKYLHDHRVIHRDLKLGNLFLSDKMEIKLGDFGLATKLEFDGERKRTICGTPNYIAPEILEGKDSGHSYEVDVWSLGVIAYTLLIGKPPFETNDVKTTYRRIKMNEYTFPDGVQISSAARNMIKNILVTDPTKRLTVDEMFNHEFFKSSGSIPKLLPVSTLACAPSSSYIRQFQNSSSSSSSASAGYRQSENLVGRSQSPRRFENTTPLTGSVGLVSSASSTAYNPANIKSSQQVGLKERKDFVNTYRSGGGGVSTAGLISSEYTNQKNLQQPHGTASTYGVKPDDYPLTNGSNNNVGTTNMTSSTSIQSKNAASNAIISSAAVSSNLHNLSGGNNGATYQSYNSKQTSQNGSIQPTRNPIDKYSSSNNIHFQSSSSGSAVARARSEKMHTQPTSSLLQSYGIPLQLTGSGAGLGTQSALTQNLSGTNNLPASDSTLQAPDIWVKKWVDYSAKYGLGYLLNNGEAGIFFNDSTKIILDPETKVFEYYERRPEKAGLGVQHTLSTYPPELQKKVTLLLHFQQYLEGDDKPEKRRENSNPQGNTQTKIYVKKWLRTKHAILFIFSNKVAQVIFQDSTEIVLSDELRVLTYVNKKHERLSYPLNQLTQSSTNNEMTKRLRYTKDLLAHIYNSNNNNNNNPTTNPSTQISKNNYQQQEPVGKEPSLDSKNSNNNNNNSNSNYQSSSKPILQQRENLHFSKNASSVPSTSSQNQFSQPHSYPVAYNNFTQNENVNTLLSSKTGSISQAKTVTTGFGGAPMMTSLPKKELISNQVPGSNQVMSNSSAAHSLLKSSSIGRINSANQAQSNSLANLNNNNFNNYGMSSRKTEI